MVVCLTSARFNMKADILRQGHGNPVDPTNTEGEWVLQQDPDSYEIVRIWQPAKDDPETIEDESEALESMSCLVRGIMDGGIRVSGTTERFGKLYEGVDYVFIWFPANKTVTRRDRITNIRDKKGNILWKEEERVDQAPTIFSVTGVIPVMDPFGTHIENMALLERVETQ